jgi:hypothetical protein
MYKVKLIFLGIDSKETPLWSHQWVDWNGIDELDGIVVDWMDKEQSQLDHDNIDRKILTVLVAETQDCTDNKYHCGSCENYFAEPDDGDCPYCGGGNFVEGCIDEPEPNTEDKKCYNHCPKCNATDPDIEWDEKNWHDESASQNATCLKCGHEFSEVYVYAFTESRHNK